MKYEISTGALIGMCVASVALTVLAIVAIDSGWSLQISFTVIIAPAVMCLVGVGFGIFERLQAPNVQRRNKLKEQIQREEKERQLAHMEGLSKYHQMNEDEIKQHLEGVAKIRELGFIMQQSVYQEKEKDWAVLGGIAEGIAGPAAGIATAVDAIQDNARIKAENAARREWGAQQNQSYQKLADRAADEGPQSLSMSELNEKYDVILSWKPSTLYSFIELSDTKIDVDAQTGAVTVSVHWTQERRYRLAGLCIDGALRAKLYTCFGEYAGCAYLVLPKEGTAKSSGTLSGICVKPKAQTIDQYTVKIEPVDLWEFASKGNATKLTSDKLKDSAHRKIVADSEAKFRAEARS